MAPRGQRGMVLATTLCVLAIFCPAFAVGGPDLPPVGVSDLLAKLNLGDGVSKWWSDCFFLTGNISIGPETIPQAATLRSYCDEEPVFELTWGSASGEVTSHFIGFLSKEDTDGVFQIRQMQYVKGDTYWYKNFEVFGLFNGGLVWCQTAFDFSLTGDQVHDPDAISTLQVTFNPMAAAYLNSRIPLTIGNVTRCQVEPDLVLPMAASGAVAAILLLAGAGIAMYVPPC